MRLIPEKSPAYQSSAEQVRNSRLFSLRMKRLNSAIIFSSPEGFSTTRSSMSGRGSSNEKEFPGTVRKKPNFVVQSGAESGLSG